MNPFANWRDWKNNLPHIESMLRQTLAKAEERLAAEGVDGPATFDDHQERLDARLRERLQGFKALQERAAEQFTQLDAELAADEENLRRQIADMVTFRTQLAEWLANQQ